MRHPQAGRHGVSRRSCCSGPMSPPPPSLHIPYGRDSHPAGRIVARNRPGATHRPPVVSHHYGKGSSRTPCICCHTIAFRTQAVIWSRLVPSGSLEIHHRTSGTRSGPSGDRQCRRTVCGYRHIVKPFTEIRREVPLRQGRLKRISEHRREIVVPGNYHEPVAGSIFKNIICRDSCSRRPAVVDKLQYGTGTLCLRDRIPESFCGCRSLLPSYGSSLGGICPKEAQGQDTGEKYDIIQ